MGPVADSLNGSVAVPAAEAVPPSTPALATRSHTRLFLEFLPGLLFQAVMWLLSWLPCSIAVPLARQLGRCRGCRPKELTELRRANMKTSLGASDTQAREWISRVQELEAQ